MTEYAAAAWQIVPKEFNNRVSFRCKASTLVEQRDCLYFNPESIAGIEYECIYKDEDTEECTYARPDEE